MSGLTSEQQAFRLSCLDLAAREFGSMRNVDFIVVAAERFAAFVEGTPAQTPRERINAALEAADVR